MDFRPSWPPLIVIMAYLEVVPGDSLTFTPDEGKNELRATMRLTNKSTVSTAFKVKTTAPKQYTVQPNKGFLEPGAALVVSVTATAKAEVEAAHKFQLVAVQHRSATDPVPEDAWKSGKAQTVVLAAKALAQASEFASIRSSSMMTTQSLVREALGEGEEDEGLRTECEALKRAVEDLKLKVRVMNNGVAARRAGEVGKEKSKGYGNGHVALCFALGLVGSLVLSYRA